MNEPLLVERRGPVLWLTLNRPDVHNALNLALCTALREAFERASADEKVRVIVLTGAGERTFCSGADLKENNGGMFTSPNGANPVADVLRAMTACNRLIIGRINGSALAGGLGLVSACDLVYAAEHAKFSLPEVRTGLFPLMVSTFLIRQLPRRRFQELAFLGKAMAAAEAERYGLITGVTPAAGLDAEIDRTVATLLANSPMALSTGKQAMQQMQDMAVPDMLAFAEKMIGTLSASADAVEGRAAFAEKRTPRWAEPMDES